MAVKTDRIKERESLKGDIRADVAVIGGGMAGILAAYTLEREGVHTVVLEAEAASKLGAPASRCPPASLVRKLEIPVPCAGGVKFRGQAQFHPLNFPGMYFTRMPFHRTDSRPRRSRRS